MRMNKCVSCDKKHHVIEFSDVVTDYIVMECCCGDSKVSASYLEVELDENILMKRWNELNTISETAEISEEQWDSLSAARHNPTHNRMNSVRSVRPFNDNTVSGVISGVFEKQVKGENGWGGVEEVPEATVLKLLGEGVVLDMKMGRRAEKWEERPWARYRWVNVIKKD